MKKKAYYYVPYGDDYQHGNDIMTVYLTRQEYLEWKSRKDWWNVPGPVFESYLSAAYYTDD